MLQYDCMVLDGWDVCIIYNIFSITHALYYIYYNDTCMLNTYYYIRI